MLANSQHRILFNGSAQIVPRTYRAGRLMFNRAWVVELYLGAAIVSTTSCCLVDLRSCNHFFPNTAIYASKMAIAYVHLATTVPFRPLTTETHKPLFGACGEQVFIISNVGCSLNLLPAP